MKKFSRYRKLLAGAWAIGAAVSLYAACETCTYVSEIYTGNNTWLVYFPPRHICDYPVTSQFDCLIASWDTQYYTIDYKWFDANGWHYFRGTVYYPYHPCYTNDTMCPYT